MTRRRPAHRPMPSEGAPLAWRSHPTAIDARRPAGPLASLGVLAAAGALVVSGAAWAQAGSPPAASAVPVLRGVVSGQAIVNAPVPTATGNRLVIDQTSSRAIIDWRSFDIGRGSEVQFNQPGVNASALNRIYSADPTVIQGKLYTVGPIDPKTGKATAGGQLVLINQNGILFDRGAQVNAYSLVASTLNITNDFFLRGLLAGDDPGSPQPAFAGGYRIDGNGATDPALRPVGAIRIGVGGPADAPAPQIATPAGGNILLFAPVVDNRTGVLTAPDGQIILAAGSKVYLGALGAPAQGVRGFLVEVSADNGDVNLTSLVRNQGVITSDRGNVTLAALAVNQQGRVSASTAVLYNGSVWLKAASRERQGGVGPLEPARAGTVTLGPQSVTATPIDTTDTTTLAESQAYASSNNADDRRGRIRIEGGTIVHQGAIEAPGGRVSMDATSPVAGERPRIYLDRGSRIDASGAWADVAHGSNFATFRVTSSELKDSPDQKDGVLRGATVTVDLRRGSSVLDVSGYVDGRRRTVAEKAADGGQVDLSSQAEVIQRPGAIVDVSGGGYRYEGGVSRTSQFLGADGRVYDISTAPKDRPYLAQLDKVTRDDARWGQTTVFDGPLATAGVADAAYVEGRPGGRLNVIAPQGLVLDGELRGGATTGVNQLGRAPAGATVALGTDLNLGNTSQPVPALRFVRDALDRLGEAFGPDTPMPDDPRRRTEIALDALFNGRRSQDDPPGASAAPARFGRIEVNSRGAVEVPEGLVLDAGIGTSVVLRGNRVGVDGSIFAPGGVVVLQGRSVPGSDPTTTPDRIALGAGATISTAGLWLNNASADGSPVGPALPSAFVPVAASAAVASTRGGSIELSGNAFDLPAGSRLDVSGGGAVARGGRITPGVAGSISLAADQDPSPTFNRVAGTLEGYSLGGAGGALTITAQQVQVGSGRAVADTVLRLEEDLFTQGGFGAFTVNSVRALDVAPDAQIRPVTASRVIDASAAATLLTGGDLGAAARVEQLPPDRRPAASLALSAGGAAGDATLRLPQGASIVTDPRGRVTLDAVAGLEVNGRVEAPAGTIALTLRGASATTPTLVLGPEAELLARGAYIARPSDLGLRQGTVLPGGSVTVAATRGGIAADAGSRIDVSGTSQVLDLPTTGAASDVTLARTVASPAGTLTVRAQQRTTFDSQVQGQGGGEGAAGGAFAFEFTNRAERIRPGDTSVDRRIVLSQAPSSLPETPQTVDAAIDANRLVNGGFDKIRLQSGGRIETTGRVTLDFDRGVTLDAPELRIADDSTLRIESATVTLANTFGNVPAPGFQGSAGARNNGEPSRPIATRPGTGRLEVNAGTVDLLGDVTINGVADSRIAATGDLRLSGRVVGNPLTATTEAPATLAGSLVSAGDLSLQAAQVMPTTRSSFTVAVAQRNASGATTVVPEGTLRIDAGAVAPGAALSADGALTLRAAEVVQAGTVKAPLGRITVDATERASFEPGSVTSVSAEGLTIPFGATVDQRDWIYAPTATRPDIGAVVAPPSKAITINAPQVEVARGSRIDISGGGTVQAAEFVPGTGGSADTLIKDNTFAILPAAALTAAPVDREITARRDLGFGPVTSRPDALTYDTIHIGLGAGVPAGDYVLLPGRYALLPGAFLVTLQTGAPYQNLQPGQTVGLPNGDVVVAGYRKVAGTSVREDGSVGVLVRPGSAARRESDYALSEADFFAQRADRLRQVVPTLPADAGRLAIGAATALRLDGEVAAQAAATARGAVVDLTAPRLAVVDGDATAGLDPSFVRLDAGNLSRIGGSLLIGGVRSETVTGTRIEARASEVVLANTQQTLQAPELLLAATDTVTVRSGATARGEGDGARSPAAGRVQADARGALVRLAGGEAATIDRGPAPQGDRGRIRVEAGATLAASGSAALDATRSVLVDGRVEVAPLGALALASGSVSLGGADPTAPEALVLDAAALRRLDGLGSVSLKSYQTVTLVGDVAVGSATLGALEIDTPRLRAAQPSVGGPGASLAAQSVSLRNSSAGADSATPGAGRLLVDAATVTLAEGRKALDGFAQVEVRATAAVVADGVGVTTVAAPLTLTTPRIEAALGSDQSWRATASDGTAYAVTLQRPAAAGSTTVERPAPASGRLSVEGRSVRVDTEVSVRSGELALAATGTDATDGVTLAAAARIDVGSHTQAFDDRSATADAGRVDLRASSGAVTVEAGSRIDLGGRGGRDAGELSVRGGSVQLDGSLLAQASPGGRAGSAIVDAGALPNASAVNAALEAGGFGERRALRARAGDLVLGASDVLTARQIELTADAGAVAVAGRLDAASPRGGARVELHAGTGVTITGQIEASGRDAGAAGGRLVADARAGRVTLSADATVDLRPGAAGAPGQAEFVVTRSPSNALDTDLLGQVLTGPGGQVAVVGRRVETAVAEVTPGQMAAWAANHAAFVAGADVAGALRGVRTDGSRHVRGALEVQASGDLRLSSDWDLTTPAWRTANAGGQAEPGQLTVRAGGDLTVSRSIGHPDDRLVDGRTWSIRMTAGADLSGANPRAVQALDRLGTGGNLRLAPADPPLLVDAVDPGGSPVFDPNTGEPSQVAVDQMAKIRTGTGSIELTAGRDLVAERGSRPQDDARRVIYTGGAPAAPDDRQAMVEGIDTPWAQGGGDVSLSAQRDVVGQPAGWVTEWLRRPRGGTVELEERGWFVHRPNFQYLAGTLGGGAVRVDAGRDVRDVSVAAPTMGRVDEGGSLQVTGGGDVSVRAGRDVDGGELLVALGRGEVRAGGGVGATTPVQVHLMGEGGMGRPSGGTVDVSGRTGVRLQSVDNPTALGLPASRSLGPQAFRPEIDGDGNPFLNPDTGLPFYLPVAARNYDALTGGGALGFYTYAPTSAIDVQALTGAVLLGVRPLRRPGLTPEATDVIGRSVTTGSAYPAQVSVVAFNGSITGTPDRPVATVFPAPASQVTLLSRNEVRQLNVVASDRGPSVLPTWDRPEPGETVSLGASGTTPRVALAPIDVPYRYDVVAVQGDVTNVGLTVPAAARVQAGRDLVGGSFSLQNQSATDLSVLRAVEGDVRPAAVGIGGPGRLLVQAGRNIDLGGAAMLSFGNTRNPTLGLPDGARMTLIAGVRGPVDLSKLPAAWTEFADLNKAQNQALELYKLLDTERDPQRVLGATSVADLAGTNPAYAPFVALGEQFPTLLATYQDALRTTRVPLGSSPDLARALELYRSLNAERDDARLREILSAPSLEALAGRPGFGALAPYVSLDQAYPVLFTDYRNRRANGFEPTTVLPIVFGDVLDRSIESVFPAAQVGRGNIDSFLTSIQSLANGDIELIAPAGDITVGLTTPRVGREVGVITTGGGAIRSVLGGNFNINQGKVVTAQGGDILIFTTRGNIDAGRGARTSQTSPAPVREPVVEDGVIVGFISRIPPGFSGSGIQTLSSDPDGQGPLAPAPAGTVLLFTPSGFVDAGEAGIVSGGDLFIVAQTVLNAANITSAGASTGVPVAPTGSLASSLASGGTSTAGGSKAAEEAAAAASQAARAAAAPSAVAKPTILSVEVLGFGERNCREDDKDCFGR